MNLEVDGTKKILLVEESQGLNLHTDSQKFAVAIGGVSVQGPKGIQGDKGESGARGPIGVVSANYPLVYQQGTGTGGIISADVGPGDAQLVIGSDIRLTNHRVPLDNSVTDAKINGTLNQSKITNLISDLTLINNTLNNKSNVGHTHAASNIVSGTISIYRLPIAASGTSSSSQIVKANDVRLSNDRTPIDGSVTDDKIYSTLSPSKITGTASVVGHKHSASDINSGTISISRLPTGVNDSNHLALADHVHTSFDNLVTFNNGISVNNQILAHVGTPVSNDDAATKAYVDRVAVGLNVHQSVKYTTTANITLSGLDAQSGLDSASSITSGSRILVKDQNTQNQNGIYIAASGSWSRASDMSGTGIINWRKKVVGAYIFVDSGSTQSNTSWFANVSNDGTESIGTDPITFNKFSSITINNGDGILINGSTISAVGSNSITVSGGIGVRLKSSGGLTIDSDGLYINSVTGSMLAVGSVDISTNKITGTLPLTNGGTGAVTASDARNNLGLGTSATKNVGIVSNTVAAGDDSRLSDSRIPTGGAGGDLDGTYPNPILKADKNSGTYTKVNVNAKGLVTSGSETISNNDIATGANIAPEKINGTAVVTGDSRLSPQDQSTSSIRAIAGSGSALTAAASDHVHVFRTSHNFIIQGNIVTSDPSTGLGVPPFFASKSTNQTISLIKIIYKTFQGSVGFYIQKNGTQIVPTSNLLTAGVSKSSLITNPLPISIADEDEITIFIQTIGGSPKNLSVTLVFEHTITGS